MLVRLQEGAKPMVDPDKPQAAGAMDEVMFAPATLRERLKFLAQDLYSQALENMRERMKLKQAKDNAPPDP